MYIIRDKATRKVIHINPAPLSQGLEGTDIYYLFDSRTMEVGRGEFPEVPEPFHIDAKGNIVPWTLKEKVEAGLVQLPPHQKLVGDQLVEKTLAEKVASGVITLRPEEKLADDQIVPKSVSEQVAEKLIPLTPTQVLDGESIREMTDAEKVAAGFIKLDKTQKVVGREIVPKSRAELAREKLIQLDPDEKLQGEEVIKLTRRQMLDEGRIQLEQYKQEAIERHTQANLEARRKALPDHELLYAAIGALGQDRVAMYRATVEGFLRPLEQAKAAIQKAKDANTVDAVPMKYEQGSDEPRPSTQASPATPATSASRKKK
ncbi:hypothetical protein HMI49_15735 [Corallococcus exercitus]|uniref:Uncharacterized protein n=1 Tax=Corallococcus exercitus TaxID=2316736 RepID=A0A7Y4KJ43_9BACT|nr:hypothetical protein [Corallococcus exercitus]NOK34651.1 hypothetical protein [Corallococcus exercitus]